jgi:hypothetical protein
MAACNAHYKWCLLLLSIVFLIGYGNVDWILISKSSSSTSSSNSTSSWLQNAATTSRKSNYSNQVVLENKGNATTNILEEPAPSSSSPLPPPCWRPCPHGRPNRIRYTHIDTAGLYDRAYLLETLANLAAYLCATLEFPSPALELAVKHNNYDFNTNTSTSIDARVSWYDFYSLQYYNASDDAPSVMEYSTTSTPTTVPKTGHETSSTTTTTTIQISTSRAEYLWKDLQQAESIVAASHSNGNGNTSPTFYWAISESWWLARKALEQPLARRYSQPAWGYHNNLSMLPDLTGKKQRSHHGSYNYNYCQYISMKAPKLLQDLVDQIWESIMQQQHQQQKQEQQQHRSSSNSIHPAGDWKIGIWHIRRGDAVEECDTSLPRMKSYLECSLKGLEDYSSTNTTSTTATNTAAPKTTISIWLASDERSKKYRHAIQKLIETTGGGAGGTTITFVDLDEVVAQHIVRTADQKRGETMPMRVPPTSYYHHLQTTNNNYYRFRIIDLLFGRADFVLEQRRRHACHDCDSVVDMLKTETKPTNNN